MASDTAGKSIELENLRKLTESGDVMEALLSTVKVVMDAPTDTTIASVASTLEKLMLIADTAAKNSEEIVSAINKLIWLERSGTLDALISAGALIKIMQDSITDEVVARNAEMLANLGLIMSKLSDEKAMNMLNAMADAICRCEGDIKPAGFRELIKALRDEDVKKSLGMLLNLAKELGRNI
jgi:uncharacterized protein YjgD (DUF1641 family)